MLFRPGSRLPGQRDRGAMAQLVARLVRNEKVRGSNPLSSTHRNRAPTRPDANRRTESHDCHSDSTPVRVPPSVPPSVQTSQSSLVSRRSEMVQIEVRRRDRRVPHPRLDRHRIHPASQPQACGRIPQIMDPPARSRRRPIERPLERRRERGLYCDPAPLSAVTNRRPSPVAGSRSSRQRPGRGRPGS